MPQSPPMVPISDANPFGTSSSIGSLTKPLFRSTLINPESVKDKVKWKDTKAGKKAMLWDRLSFMSTLTIGILGAAALIVVVYLDRPTEKYCLVMEENFDTLDSSVWTNEVQVGDNYGYNTFQMMTNSANNSFVEDGVLYIVPTLTSDNLGTEAITNAATVNMTFGSTWGTCTTVAAKTTEAGITGEDPCYAHSNSSLGYVLPSVQSAHLTTKLSKSIQFGRVEISARMPTGDWIWPRISLMPKNNVYGSWPASGEIDIVQSRGNAVTSRSDDNVNAINGELLWGVDSTHWTTSGLTKSIIRNYFNSKFYSFGVDWTKKKVFTWKDKRSRQVLSFDWSSNLWKQGNFANTDRSATNPWDSTNPEIVQASAAPFDQDFYLDLSVRVGGTSGYFGDNSDKPWANTNSAEEAATAFWADKANWYATWPTDVKKRALAIDSIKLYRLLGAGESCSA